MELIYMALDTIVTTWRNNPTFYAGVSGTVIAVLSIRAQRRTSREKNSLDFEVAYKRNESVAAAWSELLRIYKDRGHFPLEHWAQPANSQSAGAKALKTIFNEWERCANAVHHHLYDEKYLYCVYGSTLIFLDISFEPYMAECRKNNPRVYKNMKVLALRWRVRRAVEDADNKIKKRAMLLRKAQRCIDELSVIH